jgi:hypothetical protein
MAILKDKVIVDLCSGSGNWSEPYRKAGYIVIRHDIAMGPDHDVRFLPKPKIKTYCVLAAPPCTYFASSGARWKRTSAEMIEGLSVVDACLRYIIFSNPHFWALENPVGKLSSFLGKPDYYFDPCDFGDSYTKKTCLWGKFNKPILKPVQPVGKNPIHFMSPSPNRGINRSITPLKFAEAFFEANQ